MDGSGSVRRPAVHFTVTRRVALASAVLALTVAGHTSAGGMLPSAGGLLLVNLMAAGLTLVATTRARSWAWLFVFLLGSQFLLHAVLVVSSGQAHMAYGPMPLVPTGWMAIAHIAVSIVAAAVLAYGEATLRAWAGLLSSTFGIRLAVAGPIVEDPSPVALRENWWPKATDRTWDVSRRGPPRPKRAL